MAGVAASSERAMWWEHEPIGLSSHLPQEATCYCCWCLQLADWRLIICPEVSLMRCWQCLECTPFCNDSLFFYLRLLSRYFQLCSPSQNTFLSPMWSNNHNLITNNRSDQRIKDNFQSRKANVPITFTLYIKLDGPCSGIDSVRPPWFGISTISRLYLYTCAFEILSVPDKY